ncbi:MAG: hypothetical protein U0531_11550 [Dehalococcoidia bacterium]
MADGIFEVEAKAFVGFVAPQTSLSLAISPNPTIAGATGTATVRFNRVNANCGDIIGGANRPTTSGAVCIDTATGNTLLVNNGTVLNGNVVYLIQDTNVAQWATQQPNVANPVVPTNLSGFVTSPNQTVVRCGFPAATSTYAPFGTFNPGGSSIFTSGVLASYFGGCETTVATYRAIQPGVTNITATFTPDPPGAYGQNLIAGSSVPPQYAILGAPLGVGFNNVANPSSTRGLEVNGAGGRCPAGEGLQQHLPDRDGVRERVRGAREPLGQPDCPVGISGGVEHVPWLEPAGGPERPCRRDAAAADLRLRQQSVVARPAGGVSSRLVLRDAPAGGPFKGRRPEPDSFHPPKQVHFGQ